MQRRFLIWIQFVVILYLGSAICGWVLQAAIRPHKPNYQNYFRTAVVNTVSRQSSTFSSPIAVANGTEFINALTSLDPQNTPPGGVTLNEYDYHRMAEEEIPFGTYLTTGRLPTIYDINSAAATIRQELQTLQRTRPDLYFPGKVISLRVGWAPGQIEALAIVKHARRDAQNRETVEYRRWWLIRQGFTWRPYDFELPTTHVRMLAARPVFFGSSTVTGSDAELYQQLIESIRWLNVAVTADEPAGVQATRLANGSFPSYQLNQPLRALHAAQLARIAVLQGRLAEAEAYERTALQNWSDTPLILLARAERLLAQKQYRDAMTAVREYRNRIGDAPVAYRMEARLAVAENHDPATLITVLRNGLQEFPGNAELLIELVRHVPAGERTAIGAELARSADSTAMQTAVQVFETTHPDWLESLCTGYLQVDPNDPKIRTLAMKLRK